MTRRYLAELGEKDPERLARWAAVCGSQEALQELLGDFAEELMGVLGTEVDELERRIRLAVPRAIHIDIEADAGD